jgi:hypothetical protein
MLLTKIVSRFTCCATIRAGALVGPDAMTGHRLVAGCLQPK